MTAYTITRNDASADSIALQNAVDVIKKSAGWDTPVAELLCDLRDSIAEQVPKPAPAEPSGDVVVRNRGYWWSCDWDDESELNVWDNGDGDQRSWVFLCSEDVVIYRNETELTEMAAKPLPQSDATGALPTSPSPEVGVATSPPVASPALSWRDGYRQGTRNTRDRISALLSSLVRTLITFPEHEAIDKALAAIKADAEDDESLGYHS